MASSRFTHLSSTWPKTLPLPPALRHGNPLSLPAHGPLGFNSAKLGVFLCISFKLWPFNQTHQSIIVSLHPL